MEIQRKTLPVQHYLYVEREADIADGASIGQAMGSAFGEIFAFCGRSGVTALSMPISVYVDMPTDKMKFRGGVIVSAADAGKASGNVKSDSLPIEVVTSVHVGPYSHLNQSHNALWAYMDENGLEKSWPVWEVFVDDPTQVPEADCRTEIYRAIG